MTNEQKLNFLLTELNLAASHQKEWDENGSFEDGEVYGWSTFARGLLEGMSHE